MATYYYEFDEGKYQELKLPGPVISMQARLMSFVFHANIIWREDSKGNVKLIKNRHYDLIVNEDRMKEFFWIKLRAHNV